MVSLETLPFCLGIASLLIMSKIVTYAFNPSIPSAPFKGHWQNSADSDQTPLSAASDLRIHCLHKTGKSP